MKINLERTNCAWETTHRFHYKPQNIRAMIQYRGYKSVRYSVGPYNSHKAAISAIKSNIPPLRWGEAQWAK